MNLIDWIFVGSGSLATLLLVALYKLLTALRPPLRNIVHVEPQIRSHYDMAHVPPQMQQEQWYAAHSPYDASQNYSGFTGFVHVHGVQSGDTFRAVLVDNGTQCKLEKMVRVRG